jgi:hypothetical protein
VGEEFSELYILGPNHTFDDIPFNIKPGANYTIYLGVGNQMVASSYYTLQIKFRNATESLPNSMLGFPSTVSPLFEYKALVKFDKNWEYPLIFQVKKLTFTHDVSYLHTITINGIDYPVNKESAWNSTKTGYYYSLLVELWIFNSTSGIYQYHNRSVQLLLNMTD